MKHKLNVFELWGPEFTRQCESKAAELMQSAPAESLPPLIVLVVAIQFLKTEIEELQKILIKDWLNCD